MRLFRWPVILSASAIVLLLAAIAGNEKFTRRIINYYVVRLGGDVCEPVCILTPGCLPPESRQVVEVTLKQRSHLKRILTACRWYRGCVVYIGAADFPLDDEAVSLMGSISALRGVGLHDCQLTDEHLVLLGLCANLDSISITGNPLHGSGFAKWRHANAVLCLDAGSTNIGDETIGTLLIFQNLRSLDLSFTAVTDESCHVLARLPKLCRLVLDGTAVGDEGLMRLASCPSLSTLSVLGTTVSPEGIRRFKALRPDVTLIDVDASNTGTQVPSGSPTQP